MRVEIVNKKTDGQNKTLTLGLKSIVLIVGMMFFSNVVTFYIMKKGDLKDASTALVETEELYLLDQAKKFVYNVAAFEQKVEEIGEKLDVPPEWLMAVMHSESRFDASVKNHKGSGATGLIQFMPNTAKDFDITVDKLRNMNHIEQLDFVYDYLNFVKKKYKEYDSLTELYLAILYPKAIGGGYCYTLYQNPAQAYKMNIGLDFDKDGRVTVQDIDKRMKKVYPTAYMRNKDANGVANSFLSAFGLDR